MVGSYERKYELLRDNLGGDAISNAIGFPSPLAAVAFQLDRQVLVKKKNCQ